MKLDKCIKKRVSIRRYKNKEVDDKLILELLISARHAPSAKNKQPWKFYIAKGEIKSNIVKLMINWQEANKDVKTSVLGTAEAIKQAPALILVFRDSNSKFERSDTLSIGAAIEHILLKATELKLGSLWIADTSYVNDEISKLINTDLELFSAIELVLPMNHPKQDQENHLKK